MGIIGNLEKLKKMIHQLKAKNHCSLNSVRLLAVSKTKSVMQIEEAIHAGQFAFGENYVQEAIEKIQQLNQQYKNLEWHYIGQVQKNKIAHLANYFDWVQTIENEASAQKLNDECHKVNKKINVCIQVNVSREVQKNGILIEDVSVLAKFIIDKCPQLCLRGLMTIVLNTSDENLLEKMFVEMRACYDTLKVAYASIDTLSMGMSHDWKIAVNCGSTMVRIGSAIFGERTT